jgi:hypothetical protein
MDSCDTGVLAEALRAIVLGVPYTDLRSQTVAMLLKRDLLSSDGVPTAKGNRLLARDGNRAFDDIMKWLRTNEAKDLFNSSP